MTSILSTRSQKTAVSLPYLYSNEQAMIMAKCAKITYSPKREADKSLQKISFKLKYFNRNEPVFLIAEHDQYIVVAFKGRQELHDFINILKFFWTETKVKRIHNGFKTMYDKVHYLILFQLSQLSDTKPIYLTGHSLGGALAVVASSQLPGHIAGCYTFGSPPIGIKELDQPIQRPVYEIINDNDPFSDLDECSHYSYVGSRYILTKEQILHDQKRKTSDKNHMKAKKVFSPKAHFIKEYINRLETILQNTKTPKLSL